MSSASDKALYYIAEDLRHRILVLYEADDLRNPDKVAMWRTLLTEGELVRFTVTKTKHGENVGDTKRTPGPTGLFSTTTAAHLDGELETRMLSLAISESPKHSRQVLVANADEWVTPRPDPDLSAWRHFQSWIACKSLAADGSYAPQRVQIPFWRAVGTLASTSATRIHRDLGSTARLVAAHAIVHQMRRQRNAEGEVIATYDDYDVVRGLVNDAITEGMTLTVRQPVREVVDAVCALTNGHPDPVPVTATQIAGYLGVTQQRVQRRIQEATEAGYLVDRREHRRRGTPQQLVPGDPMPTEGDALPDVEAVRSAHECLTMTAIIDELDASGLFESEPGESVG